MILILVVALFCEYAGGDPNGGYSDYTGFTENLKNINNYDVNQYDPKAFIENINVNKNQGFIYKENYENYKDEPKYEDNKNEKKNDEKKVSIEEPKYEAPIDDYNEPKNQDYEVKNEEKSFNRFYGERKFEKYDGPKDYLVTNKNDRYRNDRRYRGRKDFEDYKYVPKCDRNEKRCVDGKDCYDKAKDRAAYDRCRDTYGNEDRYYEEQDRYFGDRYRFNYDYDNYYEKDCYDNTKDRSEYDKCRNYYKKCRDSKSSYYEYYYDENSWRNDRDCYYAGNLVGVGRNDREDVLIRPCALEDRQCIRKYFAENSNCKPAYGPIPDPLYLKRNTAYIQSANITMLMTRLRITGLSSIQITEFYVNKDTKNLVIAFSFRNLNETSPRNYFRYKRTRKESIVLSDYTTFEYNSGTFTAVIPKIPHLRLDLAEVHAFIDDVVPRLFLGPGVASSADPDVITAFARFLASLPIVSQELFLMQSQLLTAIYIQENICDFGLKLISV